MTARDRVCEHCGTSLRYLHTHKGWTALDRSRCTANTGHSPAPHHTEPFIPVIEEEA